MIKTLGYLRPIQHNVKEKGHDDKFQQPYNGS
jgi:hypothetical protein